MFLLFKVIQVVVLQVIHVENKQSEMEMLVN
jgi:hypothetical protein